MIILTIIAFVVGGYCFCLWAEHKAAKDKKEIKWPKSWSDEDYYGW